MVWIEYTGMTWRYNDGMKRIKVKDRIVYITSKQDFHFTSTEFRNANDAADNNDVPVQTPKRNPMLKIKCSSNASAPRKEKGVYT